MATGSTVRAGKAFVELFIEKKGFERDLQKTQLNLKKFAKQVGLIGAGLGAAGGAVLEFFRRASLEASDAAVTARALTAVFEGSTDAPRKFARELAKAVGDSRFEVEKTIVSFQSLTKGIGFSSDEAFKLTKRLVELSRDFAAFRNLSNEDATQRFIAALSGSSEVLDRFGINLKQAALNQKLAEQGFKETATTATELQKTLARLAIIEEALASQGAIGRAEEELKTFAGQVRASKAAIKDFGIAVGNSVLLPGKLILLVFGNITRAIGTLVDVFPILGFAIAAAAAAAGALALALLATAAAAVTAAGAAKIYAQRADIVRKKNQAWLISQLALGSAIQKGGKLGAAASAGLATWAAIAVVGTKAVLALKVAVAVLGTTLAALVGAVSFLLTPVGLITAAVVVAANEFRGLLRLGDRIKGFWRDIGDSALLRPIPIFLDEIGASLRNFGADVKKFVTTFGGIFEEGDFAGGIEAVKNTIKDARNFLFGAPKSTDVDLNANTSDAETALQNELTSNQGEADTRALRLAERIENLKTAAIKDREVREIRAIQEKYDRELSEAELTEDQIAQIRQAKQIEVENRIQQFMRDRARFEESIQARIDRLQAGAIKDRVRREIRLVEIRYDREIAEAERLNRDVTRLQKAKELEIEAVRRSARQREAEFERSILQRLEDIRIQGIQTRAVREDAAIRARYQREIEEAQRADREITNIVKAREAELAQLRQQRERERLEERSRQWREEFDIRRGLENEIARLNIQLGTEDSLEETLKLLELERKIAIQRAKEAGATAEQLRLINEKFALQKQLEEQNAAVQGASSPGRAFGTFDVLQVAAFSRTSGQGKTRLEEIAEKQLVENEKQTRVQEEIRDGQGAR